jgi:Ricin-type beta-trefoil lectin domain-like
MKHLTFFLLLILSTGIAKSQLSEGRYFIELSNGNVLEAEGGSFKNNGAKTQIWQRYHALNQLWDVKRVPGEANKYYILNVGGNKALDALDRDVNTNGCKVQLWQHYPGNLNQKWIIQPGTGKQYTVRCAASTSNKVLDVTGGVIDRGGAAIQLWDNLNRPNQLWKFTRSYDSAIVQNNFVDLRLNQSALKRQVTTAGIDRGYCTYFGNIAALEAAYKKRGYGELDLSEEFFSLVAKVMYLHPYWNEITGSNYRENQLGQSQGGGSMGWFKTGLKIPLESVMPFDHTFANPPYWDTRDQRLANDFNTGLLTSRVVKASTYYGALSATMLTDAQKNNSAEYERVLNMGYEINVKHGSHNYLVVGYDKRDPSNPVFLVKDSYDPTGTRCVDLCDLVTYADLIPIVEEAGYITQVREPGTFPELAFLGRWKLNFDGWKGTLDIYHIPGITHPVLLTANSGSALKLTDKRIGVFYDEAGNAFRVNGSIIGNKISFCLDISVPNLRWDEFRGRKFLYNLNPALDIMSGFHVDIDGKSYGGYATKGSYISHGSITNYIQNLINTNWKMNWDGQTGIVTCRVGEDASRVNGTFDYGTGTQPFSIWYDAADHSLLNIRVGDRTVRGKFLNHEKGIICGYDNLQGKILLLYKM